MERHLGQKIAYALALFCYIASVVCAIAAFLFDSTNPNDPIQAALFASVVFFVGCGIVLHVIATARLKGVLSGVDDEIHKDRAD